MDGVALITVNDPDRRNAVTTDISSGLRAAIDAAEGDPKVHAVVVTGAAVALPTPLVLAVTVVRTVRSG
jgi:enoyl-CoA hydratase